MQISKLPIFTCILIVGLIASFVYFSDQDQIVLEQIFEIYEESGIYAEEAEHYQDYISRQFNIYEKGSEAYLALINDLWRSEKKTGLILEIINNRTFFDHLVQDGPFFMTPKRYEYWLGVRETTVNPLIEQLSSRKFGLYSEHFGASNLITYVIVESSLALLIFNLLLLAVVGPYLEEYLRKRRFVFSWLLVCLVSGAVYILFSGPSQPILTGASTVINAFVVMTIVRLSFDIDWAAISKSNKNLWVLLGLLVFLVAKLIWESFVLFNFEISYLLSQLCSMLLGGGIIVLYSRLSKLMKLNQSQESYDVIDRERRVEWAKAMDDISAFEFRRAQDRLEGLIVQYPNDIDLVGQLYRLAKWEKDSEVYWKCAILLIDTAVEKDSYELALLIFKDIQKNASSRQRAKEKLAPEYYHKLMMIFVHHNDMIRAENSFLFLELAGQENIIKDACTLLMQEYKNRNDLNKSRQYEMMLERY